MFRKLKTWWMNRRLKKAAKRFVAFVMPTTAEVQGVQLKLDCYAYTIGNETESVIGKKRAELGYLDDDGICFSVPVVDLRVGESEKWERVKIDIKKAKFKRYK